MHRQPNKPRPAAIWYLVGLLPLILGITAAVTISRMSDPVPAPVVTFPAGERVEVELAEEGLTILLGPGWTAGVSVRCAVFDVVGESVPLTYGFTPDEVSYQDVSWHPAYETSDPQPPGRYTVECDASGDEIEVAVAPIRKHSQETLFSTLVSVSWLAGLAGSVIATVIVFVLRRRSKRRPRAVAAETRPTL